MKTIWKVLAAVLLVCLLLVGALAAYLTWFFDPNDYKKQMETAFAESTGRELTMSGDLELTLFPWLGLSVKDVSVSNPPEFGQEPFARIFSAQARVRLLPLLKRRVEVGKVLVNGMELHLILDALGRSNWEDFGAKGQAVEPAPAPSAAPAEGPGMAVEVSGVEVSNSRVIWEDRAKKERFEVSDVALSLGGIRPGAPMDLDLSFALQSETPRLDSTIRISGKALVQTDSNQYALTGMKADVTANGDFSGNRKVEGQLGGDIRMDGAQHTLAVEGLSFTLAGLTGSGAFTARDLDKDFSFSGSLRVSADSLRNTLENLGVKVDTREPGALGAARLELSFAGSKQAVEIKSIALALDDSKLKGSAGVQFSQPPRYSFQLAADVLNAD
ncbi:MAG: AsmA family protein, partial [Pseudomonadota bacterium]